MKFRSRDDLRAKCIDIFSRQDEVYQISVFGNEAEGSVDEYSDIDIVVCSNDRQETQRKYQHLFESISPIIGKGFIGADSRCFAEMVMLKYYSPYQKVDFSIVGALDDKTGFGPFATVYENQAKRHDQNNEMALLASVPGVVQKLNDVLFSIPRFTKCLFRNDGINMYRRWVSITNSTTVLLLEKYTGWQITTTKKKLTPPEVHALMRNISDQERQVLDIMYPRRAVMNAATSYQASVHQYIELSKQKAQHLQVSLDNGFIEYMEQFMDNEIQEWKKIE